jgi:hypothetical protein
MPLRFRCRFFFDPTAANRRRSFHKPFPSNLQSAAGTHPGRFPSRSPCRPPWHWLTGREARRVLRRKCISNLAWVALSIGSLNDNPARVYGAEMPTMLQRIDQYAPCIFQLRRSYEHNRHRLKYQMLKPDSGAKRSARSTLDVRSSKSHLLIECLTGPARTA